MSVEAVVISSAALIPELGVLTPSALLAPGEAIDFDVRDRLRGRGIRYNTLATQMGMCASDEIFRSLSPEQRCPSTRLGLVACSRFGNVDWVVDIARRVTSSGSTSLSPMGLPNASSNVLASQVSIRHGIKGVCLTLSNPGPNEENAILWASTLLDSGRCDQVLVLACEGGGEEAQWLANDRPVVTGSLGLLMGAAPFCDGVPLARRKWKRGRDTPEMGSLAEIINFVVPKGEP